MFRTIFHRYTAFMKRNCIFNNGQPKACSAGSSRPAFINAVKTFENTWKMLFWNTNSGIRIREIVIFIVGMIAFYMNTNALASVIQRVLYEVLEHRKQERFVSFN